MKTYRPPAIERDLIQSSLYRARSQLRSHIFFGADHTSKFLTLTFAEACLDRDHVRRCIDLMCQKYKRAYGGPLPYLSVLELHPRGHGYHVHMLVNVPYITQAEWQDHLWGQGIVHIKALRQKEGLNDYDETAFYLTKYLDKDAKNVPPGSRRYNKSKAWPKEPEKEYQYFPDLDSALAWMKTYTDLDDAMFKATTKHLPTGEDVHCLHLVAPLHAFEYCPN